MKRRPPNRLKRCPSRRHHRTGRNSSKPSISTRNSRKADDPSRRPDHQLDGAPTELRPRAETLRLAVGSAGSHDPLVMYQQYPASIRVELAYVRHSAVFGAHSRDVPNCVVAVRSSLVAGSWLRLRLPPMTTHSHSSSIPHRSPKLLPGQTHFDRREATPRLGPPSVGNPNVAWGNPPRATRKTGGESGSAEGRISPKLKKWAHNPSTE